MLFNTTDNTNMNIKNVQNINYWIIEDNLVFRFIKCIIDN